MITVIYSYTSENNIDYFFAKRTLKSVNGSSRTNEYKALENILYSKNIKSIKSKFCYCEIEAKRKLSFLCNGKYKY